MNSLTNAKLADICSLVTDGTHDSPKLQESGIPFIKGKHINSGRIDFESCDYISPDDHEKCIKRVKPKLDDILIANIGASIGDCARVITDHEFSIKNVALLRPDPKQIDPTYFYHFVNSPVFQRPLLNLRLGAAQPYVSLAAFRGYEVPIISDQIVQRKIGEIAESYERLIENNRRRISLLEEAARLLYREWFVHFRFPGHEHVKITDGVPDGWELTTLGSVATTNPQSHKKDKLPEILNYIDISSVSRGSINYKTEMNSADAPGRARRIAQHKDTIWSNVRPNLRAYSIVLNPETNDVFSTGFTVIRAEKVGAFYQYFFTTSDSFVDHLINHATGTSYPAVRPEDFEKAEILVPASELMDSFEAFCAPVFDQIEKLKKASSESAKARDLLLPRLMDGRLEV